MFIVSHHFYLRRFRDGYVDHGIVAHQDHALVVTRTFVAARNTLAGSPLRRVLVVVPLRVHPERADAVNSSRVEI